MYSKKVNIMVEESFEWDNTKLCPVWLCGFGKWRTLWDLIDHGCLDKGHGLLDTS